MKLDFVPPDDHFIRMLSIGIRYGAPLIADKVEQVKYAGGCQDPKGGVVIDSSNRIKLEFMGRAI